MLSQPVAIAMLVSSPVCISLAIELSVLLFLVILYLYILHSAFKDDQLRNSDGIWSISTMIYFKLECQEQCLF